MPSSSAFCSFPFRYHARQGFFQFPNTGAGAGTDPAAAVLRRVTGQQVAFIVHRQVRDMPLFKQRNQLFFPWAQFFLRAADHQHRNISVRRRTWRVFFHPQLSQGAFVVKTGGYR